MTYSQYYYLTRLKSGNLQSHKPMNERITPKST